MTWSGQAEVEEPVFTHHADTADISTAGIFYLFIFLLNCCRVSPGWGILEMLQKSHLQTERYYYLVEFLLGNWCSNAKAFSF